MSRRKIVNPAEYLRRNAPGRYVTRKSVGRLHAQMHRHGKISSCPAGAPVGHDRVWLDRHHPAEPLARRAEARTVVRAEDVHALAGLPQSKRLCHRELSRLGVAVIPAGGDKVQLVGTSPQLAGIVNQAYHGGRRRRLDIHEIVQAVEGAKPGRKRVHVTVRNRLESLVYMEQEFGLSLDDLLQNDITRIGPGAPGDRTPMAG